MHQGQLFCPESILFSEKKLIKIYLKDCLSKKDKARRIAFSFDDSK